MVSSIFDGWLWGLPFVGVSGRRRRGCRASWGVAATLGVGASRGRRVGGVYGPFWLVLRLGALQGQTKAKAAGPSTPDLSRLGAQGSRGAARGGSSLGFCFLVSHRTLALRAGLIFRPLNRAIHRGEQRLTRSKVSPALPFRAAHRETPIRAVQRQHRPESPEAAF